MYDNCENVILQIILRSNVDEDFDGRVGEPTYVSKALVPNAMYQFQVAAINGFDGDGQFSTLTTYWTNFSGML